MRCAQVGGVMPGVPVICVLIVAATAHAANPPHVIVTLADDLGWADCSPYGGKDMVKFVDNNRSSVPFSTSSRSVPPAPLAHENKRNSTANAAA